MNPARAEVWRSAALGRDTGVAVWGVRGTPVVLFPTAGGDAREVERYGLVGALEPLVEAGWLRVISCDSVPGRALMTESDLTPERFAELLYRFDVFVYHELVPWIRALDGDAGEDLVAAGASLGALFALVALCRHPDVFREAICLSGKYDLEDYFEGAEPPLDFHYASPLHFLPYLEDADHLALLRRRFVRLVCGRGRAERPGLRVSSRERAGAEGRAESRRCLGPRLASRLGELARYAAALSGRARRRSHHDSGERGMSA